MECPLSAECRFRQDQPSGFPMGSQFFPPTRSTDGPQAPAASATLCIPPGQTTATARTEHGHEAVAMPPSARAAGHSLVVLGAAGLPGAGTSSKSGRLRRLTMEHLLPGSLAAVPRGQLGAL